MVSELPVWAGAWSTKLNLVLFFGRVDNLESRWVEFLPWRIVRDYIFWEWRSSEVLHSAALGSNLDTTMIFPVMGQRRRSKPSRISMSVVSVQAKDQSRYRKKSFSDVIANVGQ